MHLKRFILRVVSLSTGVTLWGCGPIFTISRCFAYDPTWIGLSVVLPKAYYDAEQIALISYAVKDARGVCFKLVGDTDLKK